MISKENLQKLHEQKLIATCPICKLTFNTLNGKKMICPFNHETKKEIKDMPKITVTIVGADNILSDKINNSIVEERGYKYTYLKQLISRLRIVKSKVVDLTEDEQIAIIGNTLIVERNIANFAAERYSELDMDELFESFTEIASDIEELFK